jgi:hypothetical protein
MTVQVTVEVDATSSLRVTHDEKGRMMPWLRLRRYAQTALKASDSILDGLYAGHKGVQITVQQRCETRYGRTFSVILNS